MTGYPLLLDLTGRRVVVVGGGRVALRRARGLLAAGALVHVVAPHVLAELVSLGVTLHHRVYADGDLDGAWLAQACTDDPAVNAAVAAEAERRQVPCVRADAGTPTAPSQACTDAGAPAPTAPSAVGAATARWTGTAGGGSTGGSSTGTAGTASTPAVARSGDV